jgi:hypothetical protein
VRCAERSESSANSLVRIDGIGLSLKRSRRPPQPDLTGCCLGLGKAPSFVSKDEAHHRIKEPRFVRYRTGIMVAMSCDRWRAGTARSWRQLPDRFGSAVVSMPPFTRLLNFLAQINGMVERRGLPRQRVFKAGTIEFDGTGVDCIVRNLSAVGAGLEVASPAGIPHEITLSIRSCEIRRHAYIVWRKEKRLGVAFG